MQIDAVEHRTRYARLVIVAAFRRAGTFLTVHPQIAATARVHRRDQLKLRGIGDVHADAGDGHFARFQRLAQGIQSGARKFGQFVQKQNALVRQRHFPRSGFLPSADQSRHRRRMMRGTERAFGNQPPVAQQSGDRMNHADFQNFLGGHRRQQPRQTRRQHRFPRPRRTDHQQVVSARRGDFGGALGVFLPLDFPQVGKGGGGVDLSGDGGGQGLALFEMQNQFGQRFDGGDVGIAGPRGLRSLRFRADEAFVPPRGGDRGGQDARDGGDSAVQPQLAHHADVFQPLWRQNAHRAQYADRDRQVEVRSLFNHVGGGEVDRDPFRRQSQSDGAHRRADAFLAFPDGFVGQTDDRKGWQSVGDVNLRRNGQDVYSGKSDR